MVKLFQALISKFFTAFLQAFFNYMVKKIGITGETVLAMVNDLEATNLSGEEKAKKLLAQLKTLGISMGRDFVTSDLKTIIEIAVKIVKGDK